MKPIISCEFNMDAACVELKFLDGTMLSIDTIAVENEIAANMFARALISIGTNKQPTSRLQEAHNHMNQT